MTRLLRPLLRRYLALLTRAAINKHRPTIIAIKGEGPNSLLRELCYQALSLNQPVRRNQEIPESEFSLPLTVLGYKNYPASRLEWITTLLKLSLTLLKTKPYHHFLVLELNIVNDAISHYWQEILQPEHQIDSHDFKNSNLSQIIDFIAAWTAQFGLEPEIIKSILEDFVPPASRLKVYNLRQGAVLLDATHYYYPANLESILELALSLGEQAILLDTAEPDLANKFVKLINPANYQFGTGDVIILRGMRSLALRKHAGLLKLNGVKFVGYE